jgi:hypothetical protein
MSEVSCSLLIVQHYLSLKIRMKIAISSPLVALGALRKVSFMEGIATSLIPNFQSVFVGTRILDVLPASDGRSTARWEDICFS